MIREASCDSLLSELSVVLNNEDSKEFILDRLEGDTDDVRSVTELYIKGRVSCRAVEKDIQGARRQFHKVGVLART